MGIESKLLSIIPTQVWIAVVSTISKQYSQQELSCTLSVNIYTIIFLYIFFFKQEEIYYILFD